MPVVLPRLADVVVVFVAGTVAAWLTMDFYRTETTKLFGFDDDQDFRDALGWSVALGVAGAVALLGFWWALSWAVFAVVIFIAFYINNYFRRLNRSDMWMKNMNRGLIMAHWWGAMVMFFILTPFTGMVPAATLVFVALGVIIGIELVVAGVVAGGIGLFRLLKNPFKRTFMVCEQGDSHQETTIVQA